MSNGNFTVYDSKNTHSSTENVWGNNEHTNNSFIETIASTQKVSFQAATSTNRATQIVMPELTRPNAKVSRIEDLPKNTQDFLQDIKDLNDGEKINLVNQYVNGALKHKDQYDSDPSPKQSIADTLKSGIGDCDDNAVVKAHLLTMAGIEPDRIHIVAADVGYGFGEKSSGTDAHTLTFVEHEGKQLVMDSLTDDVISVDSNLNPDRTVQMNNPENAVHGPATTRISSVIGIADMNGNYWENAGTPTNPTTLSQSPSLLQPSSFPAPR